MRRVIALLALLSFLAVAGPALAHVDVRERAISAESTGRAGVPPTPAVIEHTAPAVDPGAIEAPGPSRARAKAIALIGGLPLLALAAGGASRSRRLRRAVTSATTAVLLIFIAESGPHLVHHALDPAQGEQCQVLKVTTHSEATALSDAPLHVSSTAQSLQSAAPLRPSAVGLPAACGRGPPAA